MDLRTRALHPLQAPRSSTKPQDVHTSTARAVKTRLCAVLRNERSSSGEGVVVATREISNMRASCTQTETAHR